MNLDIDDKFDKPLRLSPAQNWICDYLDKLNDKARFCPNNVRPSELIRGAVFVAQNRTSNPDWMAQAAHSYREILYSVQVQNLTLSIRQNGNFYNYCFKKLKGWFQKFFDKGSVDVSRAERIGNLLEVLHEKDQAQKIAEVLTKLFNIFSNISHHFSQKGSLKKSIKNVRDIGLVINKTTFPTEIDFDSLISVFEEAVKQSSLDPLKIHEKIDRAIANKEQDPDFLKLLLVLNFDARRYFFEKVPTNWLSWLWDNGFFDAIKQPVEDPTRYSYQMPELDYLERVAKETPVEVVAIIQNVKISETTFNPEVVDRFIRIIGELPASQIAELSEKVVNERWVWLMKEFNPSGYDFKEIVTKLSEGKKSDALIQIAQAVLTTREIADGETKDLIINPDKVFCIRDPGDSEIYEALQGIDDAFIESALGALLGIVGNLVRMADRGKTRAFEYDDFFTLYDEDLFTITLRKRNHLSRDEIKNLLAVTTRLIERVFKSVCDDETRTKQIFVDYVDSLPTSRTMWRLRLFTLAQCPNSLKDEVKTALFRLFTDPVANEYDILGETEYEKTLRLSFAYLDESDQRAFIEGVFDHFEKKIKSETDKARFYKKYGWEILSSILDFLTDVDKQRSVSSFGKEPNSEHVTIPSIGTIRGGTVVPESPVSPSNFAITVLAEKLTNEWPLEKLAEEYKNDDFLRPRGAEGLADAIKKDVKKRLNDYLDQLPLFFNREKIAPHYLYSILRAIEELLRDEQSLDSQQIEKILNLFGEICVSGKENPFKPSDDKSWLGDWVTVHRVVADILLELFRRKSTKDHFYPGHRSKVTGILQYLLTFAESPSSDEERPEYGQLHHIAINSVRGRAFESLVNLVYLDGEVFRDDAKALYCQVLEDSSLAVRFLVGRYLASFYTRDKAFVEEKLPDIFPKDDPEKFDIYLATWEGYLSNSLYQELSEVLKPYYLHAISLEPSQYTDRKYFKELDEALAVHLALVFAYFDKDMNGDLFEAFWKQKNTKRHHEFISFLGRDLLSRGQTTEKKLEVTGDVMEKLVNFWDWILGQSNTEDPEVLSAFGFWINPDREVLTDIDVIERLNKTLKKSNGDLEWEYGFLNRLVSFAQKNPTTTFELITNYMLSPEGNLNQHQSGMLRFHDEMKEALRIIYRSEDGIYKEQVTELVSTLIEKGSQRFWGLKEILV